MPVIAQTHRGEGTLTVKASSVLRSLQTWAPTNTLYYYESRLYASNGPQTRQTCYILSFRCGCKVTGALYAILGYRTQLFQTCSSWTLVHILLQCGVVTALLFDIAGSLHVSGDPMAILIDRTSTFEKSTIIPQYMVERDGVVPLLLLAFACSLAAPGTWSWNHRVARLLRLIWFVEPC